MITEWCHSPLNTLPVQPCHICVPDRQGTLYRWKPTIRENGSHGIHPIYVIRHTSFLHYEDSQDPPNCHDYYARDWPRGRFQDGKSSLFYDKKKRKCGYRDTSKDRLTLTMETATTALTSRTASAVSQSWHILPIIKTQGEFHSNYRLESDPNVALGCLKTERRTISSGCYSPQRIPSCSKYSLEHQTLAAHAFQPQERASATCLSLSPPKIDRQSRFYSKPSVSGDRSPIFYPASHTRLIDIPRQSIQLKKIYTGSNRYEM